LRFDAGIARLDYRTFVRDTLVGTLGAKDLVLGYDVRLGRDREGTPETLTALGHELGYRTHLLAPVAVGGEGVSRTTIRHLLDRGDVERAAAALGRLYELAGVVVRGKGRGRTLGVPTANLAIARDKLIPAHGVYAARVVVPGDSERRSGAVNIGVAPTFETPAAPSVEAHVLDLDADLYGQTLRLQLVARLRDERRFGDVGALAAQIRADLDAVRAIAAARGDA